MSDTAKLEEERSPLVTSEEEEAVVDMAAWLQANMFTGSITTP